MKFIKGINLGRQSDFIRSANWAIIKADQDHAQTGSLRNFLAILMLKIFIGVQETYKNHIYNKTKCFIPRILAKRD